MESLLTIDVDVAAAEELSENITSSLDRLSGMSLRELLNGALLALQKNLPKAGWMLVALLIGYILIRLLYRFLHKVLKRSKVDPAQHSFILSTVKIVLYVLLGITCVGILGINLTPMIAALGALGLAVSLAVRDILANIAGGISILFSRPFTKGNFVEINTLSGTIIEIGMVYTTLKTVDNKIIYLPNGDISRATVINYSAEPVRRLDLTFNIRENASFDDVREMMFEVITGSPWALANPQPIVRLSDQSYSYVQMSVLVWVNTKDLFDLKNYLIGEIRKRLLEHKAPE